MSMMHTEVMAWEEFVEATGIDPERLRELLSLGWIEFRTGAACQPICHVIAAIKLRSDNVRISLVLSLLSQIGWSGETVAAGPDIPPEYGFPLDVAQVVGSALS